MPTPYPDLNDLLETLVERVRGVIGREFVGAYLQGSFALGDFDLDSDCDFIVVTRSDLPEGTAAELTRLHDQLFEESPPWSEHLEGSYFPLEALRDNQAPRQPLWYLDHGSRELVRSEHCNTSIVRWIVRERGVVLDGPPSETLLDPVPVEVLRAEMWRTLNEWGAHILASPDDHRSGWFQGFIVLSYCRMLHDLHTGRAGTKRGGADWAKAEFGPDWHGLIDRAWDTRPDPATPRPVDEADFEKTLELVAMAMERSAPFEPA